MKIFESDNYKGYVQNWIKSRQGGGHGEFKKIATYLSMHTTMISHVFRGDKNLTLDQAFLLSDYMGLSKIESDYFINLVKLERASHYLFRAKIQEELEVIKKSQMDVKNRIPVNKQLDMETSTKYFSSWIYSALRILTTIEKYQTREELLERIGLDVRTGNEFLRFLIDNQLIIEENARLRPGEKITYIGKKDPNLFKHHANWRLKSLDRAPRMTEDEMMLTIPSSLSKNDFKSFKKRLLDLVGEYTSMVKETNPEMMVCFNIDFVRVE